MFSKTVPSSDEETVDYFRKYAFIVWERIIQETLTC